MAVKTPIRDTAAGAQLILAAMSFGQHRLFLPQHEISSLESVLDLQQQEAVPPAVGMIALADEAWPVYCLSGEEWGMTTVIPPSRRICLLLDDGRYQLALLCDQVESLARSPRLYPLPACMAQPAALVEALVAQDEHSVGCMTTTARLAAFCQRYIQQEEGNG